MFCDVVIFHWHRGFCRWRWWGWWWHRGGNVKSRIILLVVCLFDLTSLSALNIIIFRSASIKDLVWYDWCYDTVMRMPVIYFWFWWCRPIDMLSRALRAFDGQETLASDVDDDSGGIRRRGVINMPLHSKKEVEWGSSNGDMSSLWCTELCCLSIQTVVRPSNWS